MHGNNYGLERVKDISDLISGVNWFLCLIIGLNQTWKINGHLNAVETNCKNVGQNNDVKAVLAAPA